MPDYEEVISLGGQSIRLRQLCAADRGLLEDLGRQLEPDDLRMRFFGSFRTLPPSVLDDLMRIDPERRITLVASAVASSAPPEILAIGAAHASTEGSAELALLVRSDLKGMGLGSLLLDRLIVHCRRHGFRVLVAVVFQDNQRMLRLAEGQGFRKQHAEHGIAHLTLSLDSIAA